MTASEGLARWFVSDDPRAVLAAVAAVSGLTSGRVHKPETINRRTGKPEREGLYCAKLFGPVADLQCLCGKLAGPEHAGRTCDRCGVLCGERRLRDERWGHVASPVPLVHPRLAPRIAAALGCSVRGLMAVAGFEANLRDDGAVVPIVEEVRARGSFYIAERLGERAAELMPTLVPVTPPGWRGTRNDPQDAGYMRLINRCNRMVRLIELDAPQIILDNEARMTQQAFERAYEAVRAELRVRGPVVRAPASARGADLLRAVYDDPDDDRAREAYADHLSGHGDPRGEFIARQLASAARSRTPRIERDQLRRNLDEWLAPLAGAVMPNAGFRRGFPAVCRTLPGARARLGEPAWATVEQLETDIAALIADPALRSLHSLSAPYRAVLAVCEGSAVLHRLRALQLRLPRCPPPHAEVVTRGEALPALRELTVVQTAQHGGLEFAWLDGTALASRLERLSVAAAIESLGGLSLRWWLSFMARHPALERVSLSFGKRLLTCELRRENGAPALRVAISRVLLEQISICGSDVPVTLGRVLTEVEPYELPQLRVDSPGSLFGEEFAALVRDLRAHFGPSARLPRVWT